MATTYPVAVDDMYRIVTAAWNAGGTGAAAILGESAELRYVDVEKPGKVATDKYFGRIVESQVSEPLASLSNNVVAPGNRRYRAEGILRVELFAPKSKSSSKDKLRLLAQSVKLALRGKETPNGVEFNNVRINNVDAEELFYRLNVVAEYAYDEIG